MNQSSRTRTVDGVMEGAESCEASAALAQRERRMPGVSRMGRSLLGVGLGLAMVFGIPGCHKSAQVAGAQSAVDQNGSDPADANMASASGAQPAQVLGESAQGQDQQQGEDYSQQQAAPIVRQAPDSGQQSYDNGAADNGSGDNGQLSDQQADALYANDLTDAQASDPPPPLPDYDQPPAPDPDYMWTPGYWAWGPMGYYWVPGCWVDAPYEGALWTPGYWGFYGGFYRFHHGYWGLHIGFYGGVDYGYGYVGHGYYGGYWNGGHFFYNTTITRVNVNVVRNVYVHNVVINNVTVTGRINNRVSFNGGRGGVQARPLAAEVHVLQEKRIPPMTSQVQVQHQAAQNPQQQFSQNHGRPATAVAAGPVAKDRTLPAALPRPAAPAAQPSNQGATRPVQGQVPNQGGRPQAGPAQLQQQMRQAQPQPQQRQTQPQQAAPQSQTRLARPQPQQAQPQQQIRQAQPQPQQRQAQPQTQPQQRQVQPQQAAPRPQPPQQARPQAAQQQQAAPRPEPQAAPRPQPQAAPRPQPQAAPRPQPQAAPRPQPQAAPRPQPAPAVRPVPKEDEKPR